MFKAEMILKVRKCDQYRLFSAKILYNDVQAYGYCYNNFTVIRKGYTLL